MIVLVVARRVSAHLCHANSQRRTVVGDPIDGDHLVRLVRVSARRPAAAAVGRDPRQPDCATATVAPATAAQSPESPTATARQATHRRRANRRPVRQAPPSRTRRDANQGGECHALIHLATHRVPDRRAWRSPLAICVAMLLAANARRRAATRRFASPPTNRRSAKSSFLSMICT